MPNNIPGHNLIIHKTKAKAVIESHQCNESFESKASEVEK